MFISTSLAFGNDNDLARAILTELAKHLNRGLVQTLSPIKARLGVAVERAISNSPEFHSLLGGRLQAELGVPDPIGTVQAIINGIASGIQVEHRTVVLSGSSALRGGLTIRVLRTDLSEVLGVTGDSFTSEGNHVIPWLQWLLTGGDAFLVADYAFFPGFVAGSRTGLGVMKRGGGWRVPPEFAGTERDNWVTRAIARMEPEVELIITEEVRRVL